METELKRLLKARGDFDKDNASTHAGLSKSQSRKTSETEIPLSASKKKTKKKEEEKEGSSESFDEKYLELLTKMADEVNMKKEELLECLQIKGENGSSKHEIVNTSGNNKVLRYFFK